jgi:hypothetical protein
MLAMQPFVRWTCVAVLAVVCAASSAHAQASAEAAPGPEYERVVQQALVEFEAGHWEPALALFAQADHIFPSARTKRGMGLVMYEMGKFPEAVTYLEIAIASPVKPLTPELRQQAEGLIKQARQHYATVIVDVVPVDATTLIDDRLRAGTGRQYVNVEPGSHTIEARADGYASRRISRFLEPGSEHTVRIDLEEPDEVAEPVTESAATKQSVQLTLRSRQEGLRFWIEDLDRANRWRLLCAVPCETTLTMGEHTLGLSLDDEFPADDGQEMSLMDDQTLVGTLEEVPGSSIGTLFRYMGYGLLAIGVVSAGAGLLADSSERMGTGLGVGAVVGFIGGIFVGVGYMNGPPQHWSTIAAH